MTKYANFFISIIESDTLDYDLLEKSNINCLRERPAKIQPFEFVIPKSLQILVKRAERERVKHGN